ncbi:hypothetical protein M1771_00695 [Spiroplasma citri]|uniref:Uncharacterized protein n=1 Tax=Spiroplasma citri TaxID=2133 RepID=A0AAX3SZ51_SPICI|nr:hypothetical protein [Spiroplasma citri]WFG96566.1 hypothetical protein M0C40_00690 [Spiroplasma citri]WFH00461.1 hypothetical protein M1771_00695 [Spiroplasma citri]
MYNLTSGYLAENGYKIKVIDFCNLEKGNTWNPLKLIYDDFIKMIMTNKKKEKIKWKIKYQDKIRSLSRIVCWLTKIAKMNFGMNQQVWLFKELF